MIARQILLQHVADLAGSCRPARRGTRSSLRVSSGLWAVAVTMMACASPSETAARKPAAESARDAQDVSNGPRGPRWLATLPDVRSFDKPLLPACLTKEQMESDGHYAIISYEARVPLRFEQELVRRLQAEAQERRAHVEDFDTYFSLELSTARVTVSDNEIELLTGLSLKAFAHEVATALRGSSLHSLLPLLPRVEVPEAVTSVVVKRDARGHWSKSLELRSVPSTREAFKTWSARHSLVNAGYNEATLCKYLRGKVGDETIHVCEAPDGISLNATIGGFDVSSCPEAPIPVAP